MVTINARIYNINGEQYIHSDELGTAILAADGADDLFGCKDSQGRYHWGKGFDNALRDDTQNQYPQYKLANTNTNKKQGLVPWAKEKGWLVRFDGKGMFLYPMETVHAILRAWFKTENTHITALGLSKRFDQVIIKVKASKEIKPKAALFGVTTGRVSCTEEHVSAPPKSEKEMTVGDLLPKIGIKTQKKKYNKNLIRTQITKDFIERVTYIINAYYAVNCRLGKKGTVNQRIEAFIKSYIVIDKKEQEFVRWVLKEYYKHMKDNEYYGKTRN